MTTYKSLNEKGFSHTLLLIAVIVSLVVGFAGWRVVNNSGGDQSTDTRVQEDTSTGTPVEADLVLHNLGLESLDSVLISNNAVREYSSQGLKGFYVFGDKLSGGRTNPNFEFASLKDGTKVVSAIDGTVAFIKQQEDSDDYEVFLQPKEDSMWTVGYDHLTNVAIKKGASIEAGDVIGEPAMQNNGMTRFEIQINKDEGGQTTHHCPSTLLAQNVKDTLLAALTSMQNDWEKSTGLELYDLNGQDPVGCLVKTLTPAEAEGH